MKDANLIRHASQRTILTGWKEIARYLNMGVRTVQRYEREKKLPIRRLTNNLRGPVVAFRLELEGWVASLPKRPDCEVLPRSQPERDALKNRIIRARKLRSETVGLRSQLLNSIATLQKTVAVSQSRTVTAVGAFGANAITCSAGMQTNAAATRLTNPSRLLKPLQPIPCIRAQFGLGARWAFYLPQD
jgi:hypothetical protein